MQKKWRIKETDLNETDLQWLQKKKQLFYLQNKKKRLP